jgi:chaperone modulatory protein CbpM
MSKSAVTLIYGAVVEEEVQLTLMELCQACNADEKYILAWISEGLLEPVGESPQDWRFSGNSLRRARLALRLSRDLEIDPAGVALALDLLDEIAVLRSRLQRVGLE